MILNHTFKEDHLIGIADEDIKADYDFLISVINKTTDNAEQRKARRILHRWLYLWDESDRLATEYTDV